MSLDALVLIWLAMRAWNAQVDKVEIWTGSRLEWLDLVVGTLIHLAVTFVLLLILIMVFSALVR